VVAHVCNAHLCMHAACQTATYIVVRAECLHPICVITTNYDQLGSAADMGQTLACMYNMRELSQNDDVSDTERKTRYGTPPK
jgi:hypothetical protein